ncbi:hypothetical protein L6Z78_RS05550 [Escherichia coli]|nr:hypothetical protein [Escherichia coli]
MGFVGFSGSLPYGRLLVGQRQDIAYRNLRFVPFEYEYTVGPQHPECFGEAVAKIIAPCFFVEPPVLFPHPRVIADALEVRRIENDDRESVIGKGKGAEISYKVRL